MKRMPLAVGLSFLLVMAWACAAHAEPIDVLIKGIYDGKKISRDLAYKQAVMNAKIQAIERAGTEISSITQVENFTMKYDMVESKAKALILPGFQIIDIGYQTDGTYVVVLGEKCRSVRQRENYGGKSGRIPGPSSSSRTRSRPGRRHSPEVSIISM